VPVTLENKDAIWEHEDNTSGMEKELEPESSSDTSGVNPADLGPSALGEVAWEHTLAMAS
jgi:hypothetical protein